MRRFRWVVWKLDEISLERGDVCEEAVVTDIWTTFGFTPQRGEYIKQHSQEYLEIRLPRPCGPDNIISSSISSRAFRSGREAGRYGESEQIDYNHDRLHV